MLKKFLVGTFAVAALAFALSASAAYDFGTTTLKVGSKGEAVKTLQTLVGVKADGSFGPATKAAVIAWQKANGLTADGLFGKASMAKANGGAVVVTPSKDTTVVSGGAGTADLTAYTTGQKTKMAEGASGVNVLGFKVEASDSDIAVNNVKVQVSQITSSESQKITKYIDSVDIYKGSTKVGSVDASDLSRSTSSSIDTYSKTISLSNAVVKEGDKDAFYVKLNAIDTIDSDNAGWKLKVELLSYRYTDGSGVVSSESFNNIYNANITEDTTSDGMTLKSSTSNPDDTTVAVDETSTTDDVLALAFKLKADTDSSDVKITKLPISFTITGAGSGKTSDDVIDSVVVKIDGTSYDADLSGSASTTPTYIADLTDEDVTVSGGDTIEAKVYVTFQGQKDNYEDGATVVTASIAGSGIKSETDTQDNLSISGTQTGADLTLNTGAAVISGMKWSVSSTGSIIDFYFTVKADTADFNVLANSIIATTAGTATASAPTLSKSTGDASTISGAGGFKVAEGDTATFRVRYDITGANGTWKEITMTSVAGQTVADADQVSPTATRNVSAN